MGNNEVLVKEIQSGRTELLPDLWENVRRLAWFKMKRWMWAGVQAGMEPSDCEQVSLMALLLAVRNYDADKDAKFSTWFTTFLQREFYTAAGLRTEKQASDPLRTASSLDAPMLEDEDGITLADTILDPAAEEALATVL